MSSRASHGDSDFRAYASDGDPRVRRAPKIYRAQKKKISSLALVAIIWGLLRDRLAAEWAYCAYMAAVLNARARRRKEPPSLEAAAWDDDLETEISRDFFQPRAPQPQRLGILAKGAGIVLRPLGRALLALGEPAIKLAVVGLLLLAAIGFLAQWPMTAGPTGATAAAPPPEPVWREIYHPYAVYDLPAPQLAHEKLVYAARRNIANDGREDILTFGQFASPKNLFLRLVIYRHRAQKIAPSSFFVAMARRAAPLDLSVLRADVAEPQKSRFGDLQTAALTLSGASLKRENCRGFRLNRDKPGLTFTGFACAAAREEMSAPRLACLIDRLDLIAAGDDRPLRDFFGAAEARRAPQCDARLLRR